MASEYFKDSNHKCKERDRSLVGMKLIKTQKNPAVQLYYYIINRFEASYRAAFSKFINLC